MGLDTTHDCWHGPYSSFMRWRCEIARAAGFPPLQLMDGYYTWTQLSHTDIDAAIGLSFSPPIAGDFPQWARDLLRGAASGNIPIPWAGLKPSPLQDLLNHSDCDGELPSDRCQAIADALTEVLPNVVEEWKARTQQFIDGLAAAAAAGEDVEFH